MGAESAGVRCAHACARHSRCGGIIACTVDSPCQRVFARRDVGTGPTAWIRPTEFIGGVQTASLFGVLAAVVSRADAVQSGVCGPPGRRRVRAVDATAVSEPGSTGTDWRIHYAINLANLQCDFFLLTDAQGGETWRRFPVAPGGINGGERGDSPPVGVSHVGDAGSAVTLGLNRQS